MKEDKKNKKYFCTLDNYFVNLTFQNQNGWMRKNIFLSFLFCFAGAISVYAQRDPQLTQHMENKLQYNPAYSGTKDAICATLVYHNQWSSFKPSLDDGSTAPITQHSIFTAGMTLTKVEPTLLELD